MAFCLKVFQRGSILPEKLLLTYPLKKFPPFMEPEGSFLHAQSP